MYILHLNVNIPLPKIDEIHFIAKQLNVGISETQLYSSVLIREVDIVGYDIFRMDRSRKVGRLVCYIKQSLCYNYMSSFSPNINSIFKDIFRQFW